MEAGVIPLEQAEREMWLPNTYRPPSRDFSRVGWYRSVNTKKLYYNLLNIKQSKLEKPCDVKRNVSQPEVKGTLNCVWDDRDLSSQGSQFKSNAGHFSN